MKTTRTIRNCPTQFKFVCPKTWDSLTLTDMDTVRHCDHCSRELYFCDSDAETIAHARAGHCIAREIPDPGKLPRVFVGMPSNLPEPTPEQKLAIEWFLRERSMEDAIKNAKSNRTCPNCNSPAPPWRPSCRVCGYEMGRVAE